MGSTLIEDLELLFYRQVNCLDESCTDFSIAIWQSDRGNPSTSFVVAIYMESSAEEQLKAPSAAWAVPDVTRQKNANILDVPNLCHAL